ncbi:MAG: hypothetical protein CMO01_22225 [Thalassobius sp.]|nr:hypothetical protein [Thalassovita sp.]
MMKTKALFLLFTTLTIFYESFGQFTVNDSLDQYIEQLVIELEAPGFGISIVQDGKVIYSKGFGTRTLDKNEPVDANTLFAIGSISKSFTPIAIAMLIDEGKLSWDDKVIKHIPYFQLYDPYVTNSITIRDLLTHRSGLKWTSGGTLWYHSDLDREEIIRRMKFLEPESEFRYTPAYQNIMFIVASKVVEAVIDDTWDNFIRERIFKPLGMNNTVISEAERKLSKNIASPHIKDQDLNKIAIEQEKLDNIAPAGSFYSSANDMAKYMQFILNNGVVDNDTLVSPSSFNEILKPQIHFPIMGEPLHNEFTSYGFGWFLTPKNGDKIVEHSGGVDGMGANLVLVKNRNFGITVLSNASYTTISYALSYQILGEYLNDKEYLNFGVFAKEYFSQLDDITKNDRAELEKSKVNNTQASLSLNEYTGIYTDKMYGDISIGMDGTNLKIAFSHTPLFTGKLSHWHYDTFEIDWFDPRVPNGFITFSFDSKGNVSGFELDQSNLLDVDFTELEITKKMNTKEVVH